MVKPLWYQVFEPYTTRIDTATFQQRMVTHNPAHKEEIAWIESAIQSWCICNDFLKHVGYTTTPHGNRPNYAPNITEDNNSIVDVLFTKNLRTLDRRDECNAFIAYIVDTDFDFTMNSILQLHTDILCHTQPSVVEKHITLLYTSLQQYANLNKNTQDNTMYQTWETIHRNYPFMWLIYDIQRILQQHKKVET